MQITHVHHPQRTFFKHPKGHRNSKLKHYLLLHQLHVLESISLIHSYEQSVYASSITKCPRKGYNSMASAKAVYLKLLFKCSKM